MKTTGHSRLTHVDELTNGLTFFDRCEDGEDEKKFRTKRKDFIILWGQGEISCFFSIWAEYRIHSGAYVHNSSCL